MARNGMPEGQVEQLLGTLAQKDWHSNLSGYEAYYSRYGVGVDYAYPGRQVIGKGVYRLEFRPARVGFAPQ